MQCVLLIATTSTAPPARAARQLPSAAQRFGVLRGKVWRIAECNIKRCLLHAPIAHRLLQRRLQSRI